MPIHDWTRVKAGIFHALHHDWITEIARALNHGLLPSDYYALPEQHASGRNPDVLTLERLTNDDAEDQPSNGPSNGVVLAPPKLRPIAETDMAFYRRKQKSVTVRQVPGDRIVAMVEIVSPGNKASHHAIRAFVDKAAELLDQHIHLLMVDLHPPGRRDPQGIHNEIWQEIADEEYTMPPAKPLTLASYEAGLSIRAYVVHAAVGELLSEMPLFLAPDEAVSVPLEATYTAAFVEMPKRWKRVLEAAPV
ncbi:MAG: DUF4058 family protein [Gemmataceae bacterium]|nr:DUF4058 family protein [Gemmataceae bacterium]